MSFRILVVLSALLLSAPARAAAERPTAIPEPTDAALFALGLFGLWLGRRVARKRPPRD